MNAYGNIGIHSVSVNFSCIGPASKYLLYVSGCRVSVSTIPLCYGTVKAGIDNMQIKEHGGISIKLYLQKCLIWLMVSSLLTFVLKN